MALLLMCTAIVYTEVTYNIVQGSLQRLDMVIKNFWLAVGAPFAVVVLIQVLTTVISFKTEREIYRSIFFGAVTIVAFSNAFVAMYLLILITSREQRARSGSLDKNKIDSSTEMLKWKLMKSFALLLIVGALQLYITVSTIVFNVSMEESQASDAQSYTVSIPGIVFTLSLCVCAMYAWIPISPPREEHVQLEEAVVPVEIPNGTISFHNK
eukprot:TRINITY_DN9840_c0_g1_i1.p1 TRINITY_DN9840_c0_g1~~TRINITY_DN9840_c0_g1_i1.p1  ORF type:complete len:224 (-),score=30.36 TRINITY_DN9840_c0_g1_i1:122-754(-)